MGRRRRGRSRSDYKLEYQGGAELKLMLATRCAYRLALRLPFKWDRRAMFEHLIRQRFDEPVLHAIKIIEQSGLADCFAKSDDFLLACYGKRLRIDIPETFAAVRINWNEPTFEFSDLPAELRSEIGEWYRQRIAMHEENTRFQNCVNYLFEHAGTWGQAVRIWPDLRNLLADFNAARDFFAGQKAQSRMPSTFDPVECNWDREFMNTILAELLFIGHPEGGRVEEGLLFDA